MGFLAFRMEPSQRLQLQLHQAALTAILLYPNIHYEQKELKDHSCKAHTILSNLHIIVKI